jgi:hypothetical protein
MRNTKNIILILLSIVYLVTIILFTEYWGKNFSKTVHYKGDEFNFYLLILIIATYIFYITISISLSRFKFLLILAFPLIMLVAAIIPGFILISLPLLNGTSKDIMYAYSLSYSVLNLFGAYLYKKKTSIEIKY